MKFRGFQDQEQGVEPNTLVSGQENYPIGQNNTSVASLIQGEKTVRVRRAKMLSVLQGTAAPNTAQLYESRRFHFITVAV